VILAKIEQVTIFKDADNYWLNLYLKGSDSELVSSPCILPTDFGRDGVQVGDRFELGG